MGEWDDDYQPIKTQPEKKTEATIDKFSFIKKKDPNNASHKPIEDFER